MLNNTLKKYPALLMAAFLLATCTKQEDTYKDFLSGGEIYYPGKADSLKTFPGRNRILLTWLLVSDPKITKTTLYWHNRADSIVIPIQRSAGTDTIKKMLNPMQEGTYTFEVFTYDSKGNRSVSVSKIANVYGTNYNITLVNSTLKNFAMTRTGSDTALLDFYPGLSQHIGVDVHYKNAKGDSVFAWVPQKPDTAHVNLLKYVKGSSFIYRTLYKPEANAIDTFYTDYESRLIP